MALVYTMAEFMRCHPTARFISALWTSTRKYPEFRKKWHIFLRGKTAYQDCSRGSDKVPVSKEMIYGPSFALTLTLIYCFDTCLNNRRQTAPRILDFDLLAVERRKNTEFSSSSSQVV